jgi:hypothetical protein
MSNQLGLWFPCFHEQKSGEKVDKFCHDFCYAGLSLAPQTEHFPSAVIMGCLSTSFLHNPHFKLLHLPLKRPF